MQLLEMKTAVEFAKVELTYFSPKGPPPDQRTQETPVLFMLTFDNFSTIRGEDALLSGSSMTHRTLWNEAPVTHLQSVEEPGQGK